MARINHRYPRIYLRLNPSDLCHREKVLKYWFDKQKEIKPVEPVPTNWENRLMEK